MSRASLSLALAASLGAAPVAAQDDPLPAAEQAYLEVDFERTYELARRALEDGGQPLARLTRIYQLMGIAAAAQGLEEESRDAYIRMLALDPQAEVDRNLSPRLRSPFMEARGFWTSRSERLGAEARVVRSRALVRVRLVDPLEMASAVVVYARGAHGDYREHRSEAGPSTVVELDELLEADAVVEYYVQVLDAHGNRLIEIGDEFEPEVSGEAAERPTEGPLEPDDGDGGGGALRSPWFWIVAVAVLAGAGVGGYFLLRDDAVSLEPGLTFQ